MTSSSEFAAKFETFLIGCNSLRDDYFAKQYPSLFERTRYVLTVQEGKRYIRLVAEEYNRVDGSGPHSGSAWAFIDKTNGDVLKCAGFKAPAKGARGNIFDEANGLGRIGPYGPGYNR